MKMVTEKKQNVKPKNSLLSITKLPESFLDFPYGLGVSLLRRHGGLMRGESNTIRMRSGRYRCPWYGEPLSSCSPVTEQEGRLKSTIPLWHQDLEHYIHLVGTHGIPEEDRPQECPKCRQRKRMPHRHSQFERSVFTPSQSARISIFRFRYPVCGYVYSVIPVFLEPYQRMALDLQEEIINSIENGATLEAVAEETDTLPGGPCSEKTIGRLVRGWAERLAQLESGLWAWLIAHVPHLTLPRSSSLWTGLRSCWETVRGQLPVFGPIRFLTGVNRLCLSLAVAEHG